MTQTEQDFCDLERPTRIRERLADLSDHEAEVFIGMMRDLLVACTTRQLARLGTLFEELIAVGIEDQTRRTFAVGEEIDALRALAALE